jgi:hypothetical protein
MGLHLGGNTLPSHQHNWSSHTHSLLPISLLFMSHYNWYVQYIFIISSIITTCASLVSSQLVVTSIIIIILTILILLVNHNESKISYHTTHILLNCPRSGPFHSTPGSEYLQPPFRSNTKRETNDKCLTGTLEYHCHKITVIWNHILLY